MNHISSLVINQSVDYDKFSTITGNRHLSQSKIRGIISDIMSGLNMLPYCPIIVAENRNLIGAVQEIRNKNICDWERFKNKLKAKPNTLYQQVDTKNYILNIERIYNDGLQTRVLLT